MFVCNQTGTLPYVSTRFGKGLLNAVHEFPHHNRRNVAWPHHVPFVLLAYTPLQARMLSVAEGSNNFCTVLSGLQYSLKSFIIVHHGFISIPFGAPGYARP